jgi:hypothetical protein
VGDVELPIRFEASKEYLQFVVCFLNVIQYLSMQGTHGQIFVNWDARVFE